MKPMPLIDAYCRVRQAQSLLSVWLESELFDDAAGNMIGALITILDGVEEPIERARVEVGHE